MDVSASRWIIKVEVHRSRNCFPAVLGDLFEDGIDVRAVRPHAADARDPLSPGLASELGLLGLDRHADTGAVRKAKGAVQINLVAVSGPRHGQAHIVSCPNYIPVHVKAEL